MEIQFQNHQEGGVIPVSIGGKFKGRNGASRNNKLIGVRQRPSGRWVAEIKDTTQKIRMWLGTFETAEEAARAYDEAACLLRGSNTRTNFITQVSANSPLASRIKNILSSRKGDNKNNNNDNNRNNNNNNNKSNHNNIKQTLAISSPAYSSCISTISNNSSTTSNAEVVSVSTEKTINTQLFDDAYTPDLSSCGSELELGGKMGDSWVGGFVNGFDRFPLNQEMVELQRNGGVSTESEISEFDRMKVERQISASLYAMNGVHEYMENLNNDSNEAFWDLPPLCSLLFS